MELKGKKSKGGKELKKKSKGVIYINVIVEKEKRTCRMKLKRNYIADTMFRSRSSMSKSKFGHGLADLNTESQPCFPCGQLGVVSKHVQCCNLEVYPRQVWMSPCIFYFF